MMLFNLKTVVAVRLNTVCLILMSEEDGLLQLSLVPLKFFFFRPLPKHVMFFDSLVTVATVTEVFEI